MAEMYQYEGLEASLYDSLDELSDFDDLAFYQWFMNSVGGEALDVGCGTGRILLPLLEGGHEMVGLDGSQAMLDLCRQRLEKRDLKAELVLGDMRDFDLGAGRFGTVLVPGFSIQMLLEDADIDACLACCRGHLGAEGQLILPTYLPWEMIWDGREECPLEERKVAEAAGGKELLVASQGWRLDAQAQLLWLTNRYERRCRVSGDVLNREDKSMTLRWHLPHEMLRRLSAAGFSDVSVYGDFDFEPPDEESESIIYVARI